MPKALRVAHAERLEPQQHRLILDEFRDHGEAERLAHAQQRVHLRLGDLARQELAGDGAVHLDVFRSERLDRVEGYGPAAEAVDHQLAAERAIGVREAHRGIQPRERVALVDFEQQRARRHAVRRQLPGDEARKVGILQRLSGQIHGKARNAGTARQALDGGAHDPAVELRHQAIVLEYRQELAWRQQRPLLLAQAHQNFRHRVALGAGERQDRLAEQRELVFLQRLVQPLGRICPAGELRVHLLEEPLVVHAVF